MSIDDWDLLSNLLFWNANEYFSKVVINYYES
jgi:hypothetical protein